MLSINIITSSSNKEDLTVVQNSQLQAIIKHVPKPFHTLNNCDSHVCDMNVVYSVVNTKCIAHFTIYDETNPLLRVAYEGRPSACSIHEWIHTDEARKKFFKIQLIKVRSLISKWERESCCTLQSDILEKLFHREQLLLNASVVSDDSKNLLIDPENVHLDNINGWMLRHSFQPHHELPSIPWYLINLRHMPHFRLQMTQFLRPFLPDITTQLHWIDAVNGEHLHSLPTMNSTKPKPLFSGQGSVIPTAGYGMWMSHLSVWKRIAAGKTIALAGEDDLVVGATFGRDYPLCVDLLRHISHEEPVCIWLGYHIPLQHRAISMMNLEPRKFTTAKKCHLQQGIGGAFACLMTPAFASLLVKNFESSPAGSITTNLDVWIYRQKGGRQLTLEIPIVYSEYFNTGSAAIALAKLSQMNKISAAVKSFTK